MSERAVDPRLRAPGARPCCERIAELERLLHQANTERKDWKRWCLGHEAELRDIDRSLMVEVCSHCGERAGAGRHGHTDAPDWRWLRVEYVRADQLAGAVKALQGIRVTLEARDTDPDAAGVAYDAAGHALAALNALGRSRPWTT